MVSIPFGQISRTKKQYELAAFNPVILIESAADETTVPVPVWVMPAPYSTMNPDGLGEPEFHLKVADVAVIELALSVLGAGQAGASSTLMSSKDMSPVKEEPRLPIKRIWMVSP